MLWIKNASVSLFSPSLSISESSFWSFIHMIKSVHHHSVHSTFQYMMRPSLMSGKPLQRPGVVSVCTLLGFIVGSATFSALTPWGLFDPKSKHIQTFACVACAAITRPFSGLHYERTRTYLLCSRRRWLLSSRMCYLFHNNLICYPAY